MNSLPPPSQFPSRAARKLSLLLAGISTAAHAAEIVKANNTDPLDTASSWVGGVVPGPEDIAVIDSTLVPTSNPFYVPFDNSLNFKGLKVIGNANGVVIDTFGRGALTLNVGSSGLDFSAAASGTVFKFDDPTVNLTANQTWSVADDVTVQLNGPITKSSTALLDVAFGPLGTGGFVSGFFTPSSLLGIGTANGGTDLLAVDAGGKIVSALAAGVYTPNPNTGADNPNMSGSVNAINVVNSNTNGNSAWRLSNTLTITGGVRFGTAHATGQDWVVDVNSRNLNSGNTSVLVSPEVGAKSVIFNGGGGNIRLGNNSPLTLIQNNTAGDLIYNAQITHRVPNDSSGLIKFGPGRVILASNGNNYTGQTSINAGTLQVGNGGTSGVLSSATVIANNGTLAFNRSDTLTFANTISGTGGVTQSGVGEVVLTGTNTFTGPLNLQAGSLTFASLDNLGGAGNTSPVNFAGGSLKWATGNQLDVSTARSLVFGAGGAGFDTNGQNVVLASSIGAGGTGGLTKRGSGVLTLQGANTYQGATVVAAGTLAIANSSGSATGSGAVSVSDGARLEGAGTLAGTVSVSGGGTVAPGQAGVGTLTLGGLSLAPASILAMEVSSASSYDKIVTTGSNSLTVNGGGVNLYTAGSTAPASTEGTYQLVQYSGALQGAGPGALSVLNPQAGFAYTFGSAGGFLTLEVVQDAIISDWSAAGAGSWGSAANWSNNVPTSGYTVRFTADLGAPATITLDGDRTINGMVLDSPSAYTIARGTTGGLSFQKNSGSAAVNVFEGEHTISAPVALVSSIAISTESGSGLTISGAVSGAGGITKSGAGFIDLTGSNSFTGSINVTGGMLGFAQAAGLGTGALTLNGGTLRYDAGNTADISNRSLTFGQDGAVVDTNGNDVIWMNSVGNAGSGVLTKTGEGILALDGDNTHTGGTTVAQGTLRIDSDAALGAAGSTLTLNGGQLSTGTLDLATDTNLRPVTVGANGGSLSVDEGATFTLPGVFSGTGTLTKSGLGTFALPSDTATNSGGITVGEGVLLLDLLAGKTPVSNTIVFVNSQSAVGTGVLTLSGGTVDSSVIDGNALVVANAIRVPADKEGTLILPNRFQLTGSVGGAGTLNLRVRSDAARNDLMNNFGVAGNEFTGTLNLQNATADGTTPTTVRLMANNSPAFSTAGLVGAAVNLDPGINLMVRTNSGGNVIQLGSLSGGSGGTFTNEAGGAATLQVGARNGDSSYFGNIVPGNNTANHLIKVGTGTFTYGGNNTSTGSYTVNAGTLQLTGGSETVATTTVAAGAALGGNGTLAGLITVNGTLRPDPTGTLGGRLSLVAGSSLNLTATASTQFDFGGTAFTGVNALGSVTYGGELKLNFLNTVFNGSYQLFTLNGAPTGAFTTVSATSVATTSPVTLTDSGGTWTGTIDGASLSFNAATGVLTVTNGATAVLPSVPGALAATAGNGQVGLVWNAASGADTYNVKRSTTAGGPYTTIGTNVATTGYTDTGVVNGTTYYYVVQAKNASGLSADSSEVSATPTAPTGTALDSWREDNFGTTENSGEAADAADPDGDGIPNLLEYATGTNPKSANTAPALTVGKSGDGLRLTVTYTRIADANLTYTVQGVNDLAGTWATVDTKTGDAAGATTVMDTQLISASPRRFLRLQVGYTTP